ncbi:MAG: hypothetical protein AAGB05_13970, partial [Pseudomonadota bacterium]
MSPASTRSVLARVPRLCANAVAIGIERMTTRGLILSPGHLPRDDTLCREISPELPALSTRRLEADGRIPFAREIR